MTNINCATLAPFAYSDDPNDLEGLNPEVFRIQVSDIISVRRFYSLEFLSSEGLWTWICCVIGFRV